MTNSNSEPHNLKRAVIWGSIGAGLLGLAQWILIVGIANLRTEEDVGRFTLALAVTAPVFLFTNMNLRVVQASDTRSEWTFRQYMSVRVALSGFGFLVIVALLAAGVWIAPDERAVVLTVSIAKFVETISNNYYGFLQRHRRLDIVGKSMVLRGIAGSSLALVLLELTGSIAMAGLGLGIGWLVVLLGFDRRQSAAYSEGHVETRAAKSLVRKALPLGVDSTVNSVAINTPRYAVDSYLGVEALGVFSALAYLSQMMLIVSGAAGNAILPDLADMYLGGDAKGFRRIMRNIWVLSIGVMVAGPVLALVFGKFALGLLLGPAYQDPPLLAVLMFTIGIVTLHRLQGRALQAAGRYRLVLASNVAMLIMGITASIVLVPRFELVGAAWSMAIGFGTAAVVSLFGVVHVMRHLSEREAISELS